MDSTSAYAFFIIIGIIIFSIFWAICALVGRYGLRILKHIKNKEVLNEKYNVLIYLSGGILGFLIIYSPYIINPVAFLTNSILVQSINLGDSAPVAINGVVYDRAPFWSYAYWTYFYLGLAFIGALLISIGYTIFRYLRKESMGFGRSLIFFYTFITFLLLSAVSQRVAVYFIILFPLFTIFTVIGIADLVKWLLSKTTQEALKNQTKLISAVVMVLVILVPGPLLWTINDPELGYDSRYDIAGDMVSDFVNSNPGETIYIIAYDRFALRYYLSDEILDNTEIIPLFSDNYSVDALGHPFVYYPESILYNMTLAGTIDLLVDEVRFEDETENRIRTYFRANATRIPIEDELVIYEL
jgi:MFS family permease